jgi:uncharacterized protein YqgC (DUF456 family)
MIYTTWILVSVCILIGIIGAIVPALPGVGLVALAILAHKIVMPEILSWWVVGACIFLAILATILDWLSGALGAKWFGATKWGGFGALIGGIVGIIFGLPGVLLGSVAGALIGEIIFAGRDLLQSSKVSVGVVVSMVVMGFVKLGFAVAMALAFIVNVAIYYWQK